MSNTFKIGDKITINATGLNKRATECVRDTTANKAYVLTAIDTSYCSKETSLHDVQFIDDVGDTVIVYPEDVTLAEEG